MIDVLLRNGTSFRPVSGGTDGRAPALTKNFSAVSSRSLPSLSRTVIEVGPLKRAFSKDQLEVRSLFDASLVAIAKLHHNVALALANPLHVDAQLAGVDTVVSATSSQISDPATGDHRLRRRATFIDARPADMLALYQRGVQTGVRQRRAQRSARLSRADYDRVIFLYCRH